MMMLGNIVPRGRACISPEDTEFLLNAYKQYNVDLIQEKYVHNKETQRRKIHGIVSVLMR